MDWVSIALSIWSVSLIYQSIGVLGDPLCPAGFKFMAYEGDTLKLSRNFGIAYVSFGHSGYFSLSLVSNKALPRTFTCDKKDLGSVNDVIGRSDEEEEAKKKDSKRPSGTTIPDKPKRLCCVFKIEPQGPDQYLKATSARPAEFLLFPEASVDALAKERKKAGRVINFKEEEARLEEEQWEAEAEAARQAMAEEQNIINGRGGRASARKRAARAEKAKQKLVLKKALEEKAKYTKIALSFSLRVLPGMNWIEYSTDRETVSYNALTLNTGWSEAITCESLMKNLANLKSIKTEQCRPFPAKMEVKPIEEESEDKHAEVAQKRIENILGWECYPSTTVCDTGNGLGVTAFILTYVENFRRETVSLVQQYVKLAHSASGVFNAEGLFEHIIDPTKYGDGYVIGYLPMEELYKQLGVDVPSALELTAAARWNLISFCASCPGTSVKITLTEKEVKSQKHAVSSSKQLGVKVGLKTIVGGGPIIPAESELTTEISASYNRKIYNALTEALSLGSSVSIQAQCNGFYLYHFDVTIGSQKVYQTIPTKYFYCTDRPYPPQCLPRFLQTEPKAKAGSALLHPRYCKGYDVNVDFGEKPSRDSDFNTPWRSFHSGRPKPLRLVSMPKNEKAPQWEYGKKLIEEAKAKKVKSEDLVRRVGAEPEEHAQPQRQRAASADISKF